MLYGCTLRLQKLRIFVEVWTPEGQGAEQVEAARLQDAKHAKLGS